MKEKTEKEIHVPKELSWSAAEHEYVEKDVVWYLTIGGLALLLFIIALWQANYFFAIFVALAGIILANFGKRRPKVFEFRITAEGVGIGEKFFAFERLESFSLRERKDALHELIVKQNAYVNPYLRIPADRETAKRARALLAERLPEEEYQESLLDIFADWLGL
ncbi:MAG: hypothetical protein V1885_00640 [Candidatus Brennerbacteria bacterium]